MIAWVARSAGGRMSRQAEAVFSRAALEDKALRLWCAYYVITERFDRTVCTGKHEGEAVPATGQEQAEIGRHAIKVNKKLRSMFAYYGIREELQQSTKQQALRLSFYEHDVQSVREQRELEA